MQTYRKAIISHAMREAFAKRRMPKADVFVTLTTGKYGICADATDCAPSQFISDRSALALDTAAEDAAHADSNGQYVCTIHVCADGTLRLLDLTDHGHALEREAEDDAAEESAHVRGLTEGAGRRVL